MTREESIEEVAYYLESIQFHSEMEKKYRNTGMGIASKEIVANLKQCIKNSTRYHKKTFNETMDVVLMESLV
jgi:hypothetical protein